MRSARWRAAPLGVLLLVPACGPRVGGPPETLRPAPECELSLIGSPAPEPRGPGRLPDTLIVALTDAIDWSHAPRHRNDSERLLFRQLYDTLIRIDCTGRVYSPLADTWEGADGDRRWTLTLRQDARFWDGTRVTTADVVSSWESRGVVLQTVASLASVSVVDDRVVTVTFPPLARGGPDILAAPTLALTKRVSGTPWPLGTAAYLVAEATEATASTAGAVVLVPTDTSSASTSVRVEFRITPGADPRDLIDAGLDLLVTRDAAALGYAASRFEFTTVPLPWDRTYTVVSPFAVDGSVAPRGLSTDLREALARDAARSEARAAVPPYWWREFAASCDVMLPPVSPPADRSQSTNRIVYLTSDGEARSLAERLLALATGREARVELAPGARERAIAPTTAGLTDREFGRALRRGTEMAYLVRLPRLPFDPCTDLQGLIAAAPWLGSRTALVDAIVPLIDTRPRAVLRRGVTGLTIDRDGTLALPVP